MSSNTNTTATRTTDFSRSVFGVFEGSHQLSLFFGGGVQLEGSINPPPPSRK